MLPRSVVIYSHQALVELEQNFTGELLLVTQNIDNLHERAGNKKLIQMHGELLNIRCTLSGDVFKTRQQVSTDTRCNCCKKTGTLRPPPCQDSCLVWRDADAHGIDLRCSGAV